MTTTATTVEAIHWQAMAHCLSHDPELWFPIGSTDARIAEAKRICGGCPVWAECGNAALDAGERHAIIAGHRCDDRTEREQLQRLLGRAPAAANKSVYVAIGPSQRHIQHLHDELGMPLREIADHADVAHKVISNLRRGRSLLKRHPGQISREIADRILTVTADTDQEAKAA